MNRCWRITLAACGCWLATANAACAFDRIDDFAKAKPGLQQQLRSKQPSMRIEAIKRLEAFPIAEVVRLLDHYLSDSDDDVRAVAFATLLKMSSNHEVCETLLSLEKKAIVRKNNSQEAGVLLALLLSSNLPSVKRDTDDFLEKMTTVHGLEVVESLADEMGSRHDEAGIPALIRLSKTKVFANQFGLRRAVVHALTEIPKRDAIAALVELLQTAHGEAKADIAEYLTLVTGQIFGMESAAWQRWWDDVKETYEYPRRSTQAPYRSALTSASGYYYGMPLFAERLVFVLDTSGSMAQGGRIEAAKRELVRAITNLPENVHFSVVVFNSTVDVWQKKLVEATQQSKRAAIHYVNSQDVAANTASYDALEAAFSFDTEAIYFLSDGAPHGGKIPAPVDIVTTITAMNKTRRVSLYTIGIGAGLPGSPLDVFLRTLAEENLGLYRRVDG